MNLFRFPLVVLIEVFKNMDFREKFLISLQSKRARNTLKLTAVIPHFSFKLSDFFHIVSAPHTYAVRSGGRLDISDQLIGGEMMRLCLYFDEVVLQDQSFEKQLILTNYVLDTFKKPSISITFFNPTLPSSVLDFMKMINQRKLCITSISYFIDSVSSEFMPRILDECTEVIDSIMIGGNYPDEFVYTPARPFRAEKLHVSGRNNWLNFDNFMNCRHLYVRFRGISNRTAQSYNSFFTKWMDSDVPLERLSLNWMKPSELQLIIEALNNSQGTIWRLNNNWFEMKRRDGSKFFINLSFDFIRIYTKQSFLKYLKKDDQLRRYLYRQTN